MNGKMVIYILCKMLGVEAALLLLPALVSLFYQEQQGIYFLIVSGILLVISLAFGTKRPTDSKIYGKEGMLVVSMAWVVWSLMGALPYFFSGVIPNFLDAFFETVSGFTTTGSSILEHVEIIPKCMMFWRAFTNWIGGMGVLILVMVITSLDEKSSMFLMRAEVAGPEKGKLLPKARDHARLLYSMYFGLTVLEFLLLCFGGMDIFESLIYSFSTAGTGGFTIHNAGLVSFNSLYFEVVVGIFMFLFGINFTLFFLLLKGRVKAALKNEELRTYIIMIIGATLLIAINVYKEFSSIGETIRHSLFHVVSVISSTGLSMKDYSVWPEFSQSILLILMVIGACAGSTGGGIKISRALMVFKSIKKEVVGILHPKSISIVKVNGKKVSNPTLRAVYVYLVAYVLIVMASTLLVSIDNMGFTETFTSVLANMSNMGAGLGKIGPAGNYAHFSVLSKLVLIADMLIGRLEIFPFFLLVSPQLWGRKF